VDVSVITIFCAPLFEYLIHSVLERWPVRLDKKLGVMNFHLLFHVLATVRAGLYIK
jgi:hypothetical protein